MPLSFQQPTPLRTASGWRSTADLRSSISRPGHCEAHTKQTFVSVAADLGYTETTIAALLGHSSRTMTSSYVHHLDSVLVNAADHVAKTVQRHVGSAYLGDQRVRYLPPLVRQLYGVHLGKWLDLPALALCQEIDHVATSLCHGLLIISVRRYRCMGPAVARGIGPNALATTTAPMPNGAACRSSGLRRMWQQVT